MAGILAKVAARVIVGVVGSPWWLFTISTQTGREMYNEASEQTAEILSEELSGPPKVYAQIEDYRKRQADESVLYWRRDWEKKKASRK